MNESLLPRDPKVSASSAMAALRAATQDIHDRVERTLQITHPDAGPDEYIDYLVDLYGWLAPFEHDLWARKWPLEMAPQERCEKVLWIEKDLQASGFDSAMLSAIPRCPFVPDLDSLPARMGTAYVIEGAQLGTRVLRKTLGPALEPWTPRLLEGYGDCAGRNWKLFMECAEKWLTCESERRLAAAAARRTFQSLVDWFEHRQRLRVQAA